jgi:6-hydroxycyclohex-1-ene-1-carbonyl-CoA dehydrogenase
MNVRSWVVEKPSEPMVCRERAESPGAEQVLVQVAGCGVCHTDLGFFYEGVPTRRRFPLTLGHEISGTVVEAGAAAREWIGRAVVVPAVIPCGVCPACRAGRGSICPRQIFPGNDVHGGFASHVVVPARGLCLVPDLADRAKNQHGVDLAELSVIADAVSTPYEAIERSGLGARDLAVFVGAGGVGGFGVQIAAARGASVVAIDVDRARLAVLAEHGAGSTLDATRLEFKALKQAVKAFADEREIPSWRQFVFETSGTLEGQATAFGLLGHGGYLGVVGFTPRKLELRLSNLMALDATVRGNWGCPPERYPAILELVLAGRVRLEPFIERRPLASINQTFREIHERRTARRVVLVPEDEPWS